MEAARCAGRLAVGGPTAGEAGGRPCGGLPPRPRSASSDLNAPGMYCDALATVLLACVVLMLDLLVLWV